MREPQHVCVCERETYVIISHSPPTAADIFGGGKESLVTQQGSMWAFYIRNTFASIKNNNPYQDSMPDRGQVKVIGFFPTNSVCYVFVIES